jgi:redox-sensitive bicupin YhaK (pirin superfamily)
MVGALPIDQDATIFGALLPTGTGVTHDLDPGRRAYLAVPRGRIEVNGVVVYAGDGLAVAGQTSLQIEATTQSELVLADLP